MEAPADIVIVSAFGRGNWLATQLAQQSEKARAGGGVAGAAESTGPWKVLLIDVTESLGGWKAEDAEGPLGLFDTSDISEYQKQRLFSEGEMLASGFTIWLKSGPIEFQGPLAQHHSASHHLESHVLPYLRSGAGSDRKRLAKQPFREAWLASFAHQLGARLYEENHRALSSGIPMPLNAGFSQRQVSEAGWRRGLEDCRKAGVTVRERARVLDMRLQDRAVEAIEINDQRDGIVRGRTFLWTLTSGETEFAAKNVFAKIFARGATQPTWAWSRFRFEMRGEANDDQLPPHFAMLEDPFLPWTHANLTVVKRRAQPRAYDAWVRLPTRVRFDQTYLRGIGLEIEKNLGARVPQLMPTLVDLPSDALAGETRVGAPLVPVFEAGELREWHGLKAPNLFYSSPEQFETIDWNGLFHQQNEVFVRLEKMRAAWLAVERKRAARLAAQEARRNPPPPPSSPPPTDANQ